MSKSGNKLWARLKAFGRDEQGADMVEYVLIVAAIALPIMGVALYYWHEIRDQVKNWWETIKGDTGNPVIGPGG